MPRIKVTGGEPEFKLYPKGTYDIVVDDVTEGASRTKGTSQLIVKGRIQGGPNDGSKVTDFFARTENSGWRIKALLDACGIDYDEVDTGAQSASGKPLKNWEFDTDDLAGCVYQCDADQEEYEGAMKQRWGTPRPPAGASAARAVAPTGGNGQAVQAAPVQPQTQEAPRRVRRVTP